MIVGDIQILINNVSGPPGGPLIENELTDFDGPFKRHLHASHVDNKIINTWNGTKKDWKDNKCDFYFC